MKIKTRNIKVPLFGSLLSNKEYEFKILTPDNKHDLDMKIEVQGEKFLVDLEFEDLQYFTIESNLLMFETWSGFCLDLDEILDYLEDVYDDDDTITYEQIKTELQLYLNKEK